MSQPKEADTGTLQFAWGDKRGRGKDNVQFYGSFTYDGMEYSLYDCVFLYHEREPEPYIGKIVKIWEQPVKKRRVKILWFFRPIEVRNFLGGYKKPIWNEVFLACGVGAGLFNVNPLEAIAGKCNVICTSKDKRNPQPLEEDLKLADYIFYRTFDVGTRTISEKIGDDIAGVEAKHIFNWKEALEKSVIGERSDKNEASEKTPHSLGLAPAGDQDVSKNLSVAKAIPKCEPALDTDARKTSLDSSDDRPPKKTKLLDSAKLSENLQRNGSTLQKNEVVLNEIDKKTSANVTKVALDKAKSKHNTDSVGFNKAPAMKSKLDAIPSKLSDKSMTSHHMKEQQAANETVVVPRKPEDTSKWFTGLPWEDRLWKAHEQGTLLLLENFDISYTSEEIEDLIYHFFKKKCTARVIELSTFSNPYNGQALIICKSRGDADEIVKELRTKVLMLSNGRSFLLPFLLLCLEQHGIEGEVFLVIRGVTTALRPLVGRRVIPRQSGKSSKFFGHLHIDKLKHHVQREEWRKAVFTSHCSQPNTIEYEMGMEWMLLQERSSSWWKELQKVQKDEIRRSMKEARK